MILFCSLHSQAAKTIFEIKNEKCSSWQMNVWNLLDLQYVEKQVTKDGLLPLKTSFCILCDKGIIISSFKTIFKLNIISRMTFLYYLTRRNMCCLCGFLKEQLPSNISLK